MSDGTVRSWGANWYGELGNGTNCHVSGTPMPTSECVGSTVPVQVVGPGGTGVLSKIVAVAAGQYHSMALDSSGHVWTWGGNYQGQLGNGTTCSADPCVGSATPVEVHGVGNVGVLGNIVAIAAGPGSDGNWHNGGSNSVALASNGTVYVWGYGNGGQLGNNACCNASQTPVQVVGPSGSGLLTGITAIAMGHWTVYALRNDGTVWAWGVNSMGQVGDNSVGANRSIPVEVRGPSGGAGTALTGIKAIAAGDNNAYALTATGTVWAWGSNGNGQVGNNVFAANQPYPAQVQRVGGGGPLTGVSAIAGGDDYALALTTTGSVLAWGDGQQGELGNGSSNDRALPVAINIGGSTVTSISAGGETSLIVRKS